jgi:hypothetical protein
MGGTPILGFQLVRLPHGLKDRFFTSDSRISLIQSSSPLSNISGRHCAAFPIPSPPSQTVYAMCNNTMPSLPVQIIEGQYLDQQRLMALLKNVYGTSEEGKNNFRVEVNCVTPIERPLLTLPTQLRLNRYKIYPSEHARNAKLTDVLNPSPTVVIEDFANLPSRSRYRTVEHIGDGNVIEIKEICIQRTSKA